uniref:Putative fyve finger-containing protein n=1 Tax=Tabanus bromius TaxID=304241 RepID=A0A0K8TKD5_TABBR
MPNPFDDDGEQILEGFLCPICREDLKTPERLTSHVETVHAEEQDLLKSLRDIFSKAKRKIKLNFDETIDLSKHRDLLQRSNVNKTQFNVILTDPQSLGALQDNFSEFKSIRMPWLERCANETNKLIIRLHKLLRDRPTDPVQRKIHEQKTVPWFDGKSVNLCPNCAKSFHLARRQHHCRLCGCIMCNDCSRFLDIDVATNLIDPSASTFPRTENADKEKDHDNLRICEHCLRLLENRKEMQDSRTHKPPISLYYEKISELKKEIGPDIKMYNKIIKSLYEGDAVFTLSDAGALRAKIGHVAEKIDSISKAIMSLPAPEGSRDHALKKSIRLACVQFIKEEMLSIPPLPLEEKIKELQEKRRMEVEQKIERDRRLAMEAYEKYGGSNSPSNSRRQTENSSFASGSAVTTVDNWVGQQINAGNLADPLIEQINIIKGYIKQARAALRFEEVATLEMNLRELQLEFYERYHKDEEKK